MVPDHPDRPTEQIALEDEIHTSPAWQEELVAAHSLQATIMRGFRESGLVSPHLAAELDWDHIRESLQCSTEHGIVIPGVGPDEVAQVYAFNMRQWLTRYGYPGLGRHAIGGLVGRLMEHSSDAVHGEGPPLTLYSAHDSTLVALLANLALALPGEAEWPAWALDWPPYASLLEVETWRHTSQRHKGGYAEASVRFVYNGAVLPHERGDPGDPHGLVPLR